MSVRATSLYAGLISGTSMDGVDAALVTLGPRSCELVHTHAHPYDAALRRAVLKASREPESCSLDELGELDHRVGIAFRDAALALLEESGTAPADVAAIGSHGQTLRHQPRARHPFTLQIGDPNLIAAGTGVTTVADLRRRDLAVGGEGAPLAPAFHHWLWGDEALGRAVLNIGGFANLTVLPAGDGAVSGFDTGPGNSLMDGWCERHLGKPFDDDGCWAASGRVSDALLKEMLADDYFRRAPPKSTGFEHFNAAWLDGHLDTAGPLSPEDVQATLCALTATTVADAVTLHAPRTRELMVCGGGAHNGALLDAIGARLPGVAVRSTGELGIGPDWVEAALFAWLAARCLEGLPGNLPSVTGAREPAVLGAIYPRRS